MLDFAPHEIAPENAPIQLGRMLASLRARSPTSGAKVLIMIPADLKNAAELAELAMDLGADDLVTDLVTEEELGLRVRSLLHSKALLDRRRQQVTTSLAAAMTDSLTGLNNRRIGLSHLRHLAERRHHHGEPYAVALLDIDHFKSVNDRFGHAAGDRVLAQVAQLLRAHLRAVDLVARFGGEEFLIALPRTSLGDATHVVERLRQMVATTPIALPAGETADHVLVTLSAGVAEGKDLGDEPADPAFLWRDADRALYQAKAAGRNCVVQACPMPCGAVLPPLAM